MGLDDAHMVGAHRAETHHRYANQIGAHSHLRILGTSHVRLSSGEPPIARGAVRIDLFFNAEFGTHKTWRDTIHSKQ